jgi:Holliday junction DNA helicase RuvA
MAVLSELSAAELRAVVATADKRRFAAISGVGKKTAERLVLELRDKLDAMGGAAAAPIAVSSGAPLVAPIGTRAGEAIAALVGLGFSRLEAENAVTKAEQSLGQSEPDAPLEALVRKALGALA